MKKNKISKQKDETLLEFVNRRIDEIRMRDGTPEHWEHWNDLLEIRDSLSDAK